MSIRRDHLERGEQILKALGDPIRIRIIACLNSEKRLCVSDLVDRLGTKQANVSRHLKTLRDAGLVARSQVGNRAFHTIRGSKPVEILVSVNEVLRRFFPDGANLLESHTLR